MNVLVTGGAGYIGSHAVLRLLEDGHTVAAIDDLSRGNTGAVDALQRIAPFEFREGRVGDRGLVEQVLRDREIDVVLHFAARAYVGESVAEPLSYYSRNTGDAIALLEAMQAVGVPRFIFSSTCATYGEPPDDEIPIREMCPQAPINPYGHSKRFVEQVITDHAYACRNAGVPFAAAMLRYFNVAGADRQARIGECHDPETHLVPICLQVALGQRESLTVFGEDYPTPDGTCIRDYVHVVDLIDAHVEVCGALRDGELRAYNVGIGRGYSVREVLEVSRQVTGSAIPAVVGERREGDPPTLYAEPTRIREELGWRARHSDLHRIIEDAWRWHSSHPHGYGRP